MVVSAVPVSDASLDIYSTGGKAIYQSKKPVTSDYGTFLLDTQKKLPPDFRVVCTPPADNSELTGTELVAEIRNYDPQTDSININLVTTIISRYLDNNKDKTLLEAENSVRSLLEIPEFVDINNASDNYFSHRTFLREAANNGGAGAYIDQLIGQMTNPGAKTQPFRKEMGLMAAGGGGAAGYMVDALARGAITYAGGHLFGWALSQAGLGDIFGGDEDLSDDIEEMKTALFSIQKQLNEKILLLS